MDDEFLILLQLLRQSMAAVGDEYFQLPRAGTATHYRERVYCYELYHQMRVAWPHRLDFSLCGEVHKGGHPDFRNGPYALAQPDLLIHEPGSMERNLAIVEVKAATNQDHEFQNDLKKITWFNRRARYHAGIFIVYGDSGSTAELIERVHALCDDAGVDRTVITCLYQRYAEALPVAFSIAGQ